MTSPTPPIASSPSPQALAFRCRLPVLWYASDPRVDGKTGFVTFPAGSLSTSSGALPKPPELTLSYSYDHATGRWLAVSRAAVAPDGLRYAYAEYDPPPANTRLAIGPKGRVHVVDVRTGVDRVIYRGAPTFAVVDFSADGLYLASFQASIAGSGAHGLYLMNPGSGTYQLLPGSNVSLDGGGWRVLNGGAAWGTRFSGIAGMGSGNEFFRFDMKTGKVIRWLAVPADHVLFILGFDRSGRPLVESMRRSVETGQSTDTAVSLVAAPGQATRLLTSTEVGPGENGVADSHGLWMGGGGSVWLYQPGSGLRMIRILSDPNVQVQVGGECV
jgi:hypothetical protein